MTQIFLKFKLKTIGAGEKIQIWNTSMLNYSLLDSKEKCGFCDGDGCFSK